MRTFATLLFLVAVGCSSASTVTEEDRVLVEYNRQMWQKAIHIAAAVNGGVPDMAAALAILSEDGTKAVGQLQKNWGKPKEEPKPYTRENLDEAIQASEKSHHKWWFAVGGILAGIVAVLGTASKFARFIPGIGPIVEVGLATFQGLESLMGQMKANPGDKPFLDRLVGTLKTMHDDPRLRLYADRLLLEAKKRIRLDGGGQALAPPAPPPAGSG